MWLDKALKKLFTAASSKKAFGLLSDLPARPEYRDSIFS